MTPAEQAVQANTEIEALRQVYLSAAQSFNLSRDKDPTTQIRSLEQLHQAATKFFNKVESAIIECDVLSQQRDSAWAQDLANSAVNVLESVANHFEKVRRESERLKTPAPVPSLNAYSAMQSAVSLFNQDQVQGLKDQFQKLGLPTRGFEHPTPLANAGAHPAPPAAKGWLIPFILCFLALAGLIIALIQNLPRLSQFNSQVTTVSVLVLLGLVAAIVTFGMLRSYAKVSGNQLGIAFEAGGPAAIMLIVLGVGLFYENSSKSSDFAMTVYFYTNGHDQGEVVHTNGELAVLLYKKERFAIVDGTCEMQRVPNIWNGQTPFFELNLNGYASALKTNVITLAPNARFYVPVVAKTSPDAGKIVATTTKDLPGADTGEEARKNLDWIFQDNGAAKNYQNARNAGKTRYDAALIAQGGRNQAGAYRSIVAWGSNNVESYLESRDRGRSSYLNQ